MIVEMVLAALFLLAGVRSAVVSLGETAPEEGTRARLLVALHDAAKAGFWLALGGFFLGYGLLDEPQRFRWFALVPLFMAGLRLAAAALLSRS